MSRLVSVIMPTFNRSRFLAAAFDAVRSQHHNDWELIVVDDGSTDDSAEVVKTLSASIPQPVKYLRQENQGAYGARNTGLDLATGAYIAFYDTDDIWLPHHLSACVTALEQNADVDWVYAACRLVDLETKQVIEASSFYENGVPRPFMRLKHDVRGALQVITDPEAIRCHILYGLYCGLQNSLIRRRVFEPQRFVPESRNAQGNVETSAEDQLMPIRSMAAGHRLAYLDDIHVLYGVHGENSSGAAKGQTLAKVVGLLEPMIRGYEEHAKHLTLTSRERAALRQRLSRDIFWQLGYAGYWMHGERRKALRTFARGMRLWPWDFRYWKTFASSVVKTGLGAGPGAPVTGRRD